MLHRKWLPAGVLALALGVAACGSGSSPGASAGTSSKPAASGTVALKTEKASVGTVLASASGYTLYWFSKDTSTSSACTGTCASKWPPVIGKAQAPSGVSGTFGSITRSDGKVQATYDGHPLYTFVGDTAPGQAKGNLLNVFGGVWYAVTTSAAPASSPSASSSSGSGYGY